MRKLSLTVLTGALAFIVLVHFGAQPAKSRPQYKTQFIKKYADPDSSDDKVKSLVAAVKEANCLVCHEGEKRANRNPYGKELASLLKPADAPAGFKGETDPKKISEALDKVAEIHVDAKDPKSPTYGDLLKAGKLPATAPKSGDSDKKAAP